MAWRGWALFIGSAVALALAVNLILAYNGVEVHGKSWIELIVEKAHESLQKNKLSPAQSFWLDAHTGLSAKLTLPMGNSTLFVMHREWDRTFTIWNGTEGIDIFFTGVMTPVSREDVPLHFEQPACLCPHVFQFSNGSTVALSYKPIFYTLKPVTWHAVSSPIEFQYARVIVDLKEVYYLRAGQYDFRVDAHAGLDFNGKDRSVIN